MHRGNSVSARAPFASSSLHAAQTLVPERRKRFRLLETFVVRAGRAIAFAEALPHYRSDTELGGEMRSFVAAALCAALLAGVSDASAQSGSTGGQLSSYKVGVWNAGAYSVAGSPAFAFCAGTATYNSGITVSFLLTKAGSWGIALFDPAWNLTVGTNYSIVMAVDSSASGLDTASAITTNEVLITL